MLFVGHSRCIEILSSDFRTELFVSEQAGFCIFFLEHQKRVGDSLILNIVTLDVSILSWFSTFGWSIKPITETAWRWSLFLNVSWNDTAKPFSNHPYRWSFCATSCWFPCPRPPRRPPAASKAPKPTAAAWAWHPCRPTSLAISPAWIFPTTAWARSRRLPWPPTRVSWTWMSVSTASPVWMADCAGRCLGCRLSPRTTTRCTSFERRIWAPAGAWPDFACRGIGWSWKGKSSRGCRYTRICYWMGFRITVTFFYVFLSGRGQIAHTSMCNVWYVSTKASQYLCEVIRQVIQCCSLKRMLDFEIQFQLSF